MMIDPELRQPGQDTERAAAETIEAAEGHIVVENERNANRSPSDRPEPSDLRREGPISYG